MTRSSFNARRSHLRRLLKAHDITANQVAVAADLPASTIYRLLSGEIKTPALDTWETICKAVGRLIPSTETKED